MLSYNEIIQDNRKENILSLFPIQFLSIGEIIFGGKVLITFVEFNDNDSLEKNWSEFNSYISTEVLSFKDDEFAKWNFYVFYLSKGNIKRELKYEIENNKFSSRKIVYEKCTENIDDNTIRILINEHITSDNIVEDIDNDQIVGLDRDILIDSAITKYKLPKRKGDSTEYFELVLDEIEKTLRNEI